MTSPNLSDEDIAARRFVIMNLVRVGAVIDILIGILIAQGVIDLPYFVGVVLAVLGVAAFFFAPPLLARHWKDGDRAKEQDGR